ncbi:beta-lactamase family protein [bacterium]|nr:beta-lactamase family protein [bacterium]
MRTITAIALSFLLVLSIATLTAGQALTFMSLDTVGTPAGARMNRWITTLNSGDEALWKAYTDVDVRPGGDSATSATQRLGAFQMLYGDFGGVDPIRIEESEPYRIAVLLKARNPKASNEYIIFDLIVDSLPPHHTMQLGLMEAMDPTLGIPAGTLTEGQMVEVIERYLRDQVEKDRFSGAVLLAHDGKVVYSGAFGDACKRYDAPNRTDTKFNLGSMNKMFTGVAICQLAEQGKLKFTDTVGTYLPDYPNDDVRDRVTIHQLLTHTSGMASYWDEIFEEQFWKIKTVEQLASLIWEKPLEFEPGERFGYSNSGPLVLGLIIEKITGQSYYDYIREQVTGPAGMSNTDCYEVDHPVKNLAIGYTHMDYDGEESEEWYNNLFMHAAKGGPAGGGYSTVEDLLKFHMALKNNVLLSPAYTDTLLTGKVDMMGEMKYAYLFGDEVINGHRAVGHNGGAPGINAVLRMYWDDGWTVAVMSNYDRAAVQAANLLDELVAR